MYCLESNSEPCWQNNACVSKRVFKSIEDAINNVVDNITLADLIEEERRILEFHLKEASTQDKTIQETTVNSGDSQ